MDDGLWSFFQDDFEHFAVNTFSRIHAQHLRSMYTFLRRGGVYVRTKEKRITYAILLHEVAQEERQHPWTQENLDEVYAELDGDGFQSNRMNNAIKRGLDYKLSQDPTLRTTPFQVQQLPTAQTTVPPPQTSTVPEQSTAKAPIQVLGWGKEISNAAKMYTEDLKYNGTNGSFDYKLTIFYSICNRSDVPPKLTTRLYPTC